MNLVLLFETDYIEPGKVRLTGRRHRHIVDIHRAAVGKKLCVGICNGKIGEGTITQLDDEQAIMDVSCDRLPPSPLPIVLILALPRPNVLRRTLLTAASMGVKSIVLLNFSRVEKSLWNSSALREDAIHEQLVLGLEQGKDTALPQVLLRERFKPFVEDELPGMTWGARLLVAHPESAERCPGDVKEKVVLIVGPEGGFVPYELEKMSGLGFQSIHLGERILRVDAAVPALLSKLFY